MNYTGGVGEFQPRVAATLGPEFFWTHNSERVSASELLSPLANTFGVVHTGVEPSRQTLLQ